MSPKHVAVAMSGGVDSSVTAFLLKRDDFRVSGVHLQLRPEPEQVTLDLERTCQLLDIPLYQLNFEGEFKRLIIEPFLQEYGRGRTPNPCVSCNQHIKFGLLLDKAQQMGADLLATGHYALIESLPRGHRLLKAVDRAKDQSYFLYTLGQKQLPYLLFPLSNYHKTEVRRLAAELGLPASNRHDSQDICFIPGNDYRAFIAQYAPPRPGDIVDATGNILGQHSGLAGYTIGQRHGLRLSS
ncbi:MAG: tRNA 2-thiouridine(34) synthase MnmA, partial [Dehalococcoidales bacterium]|nr:tRNA 2-thiouridine(34) synthase MnmA [Dehalococcoidales bacterium]